MKQIEIKLSQPIVAPLLDFIKSIADELRGQLTFDLHFPDADPDLQKSWREDLLQAQGDDMSDFMALFDRDFFETGNVVIDEENADKMLRAAAAIRLKLRSAYLDEVSDEILEKGDVAFEELSLQEQQAYACYLFLATIQEIVIQHLDLATGK